MRAAVESYLGVRRAAGFTLSNTEYLLHSFADFAADRKQTHIRTPTDGQPLIYWRAQRARMRATSQGETPFALGGALDPAPVLREFLQSSRRLPGPAEIGRAEAFRRPMATHS